MFFEAHTVSLFDDGIQKALDVRVNVYGNHPTNDISEDAGEPVSMEELLRTSKSKEHIDQPNLCFEVPFHLTVFCSHDTGSTVYSANPQGGFLKGF